MARKITWSQSAISDLNSNAEFIALENLFYADKVTLDIYEKGEKLTDFPQQGSRFGRFGSDREVRQVYVHRFRIIYELLNEEIRISRIVHMSQDLKKIEI